MIWKRKAEAIIPPKAQAEKVKTEVPRPSKPKQLSPQQIMISRIEQLTPEQSLFYRLPQFYWSGLGAFVVVELNPQHPAKGKRYLLSTDRIVDGKPAGARSRCFDTDKPKELAEWVLQRQGEPFSWPEN